MTMSKTAAIESAAAANVNALRLRADLAAAGVRFERPAELIDIAARFQNDNKPEMAERIAEFALMLAPEDYDTLYGASRLFFAERKFTPCNTLMRRALALKPDDDAGRLHYVDVLVALREYPRAHEQMDDYLDRHPDSGAGLRKRSDVFAGQGDFKKACEFAKKALEREPANRGYALHHINLLLINERVADAIRELKRLDAEQPDDPVIARLFSAAHEAAGDWDTALVYARHACKLAPKQLEYEQHLEHLENVRSATFADVTDKPQGKSVLPHLSREASARWRRSLGALHANGRVITNLVIREASTRFGDTQLGYVWAIFEPVSHLVVLAVAFSFMERGVAPVGDSMLVYYFTGILPYLLLTNTIQHVQVGIEENRTLLLIPIIKPLDVMWARAILELITQVSVAIIMLTAFNLYGLRSMPHDIVKCVVAIFLVWILGVGIGLVNGVAIHFVKSWGHVFMSTTRGLYFVSGIFLSPWAMPPIMLHYMAWNPLLQAISLLRSGFYQYYSPYWIDKIYLCGCAFFFLTVGLGMERAMRRKLTTLV